MIIFIVAIASLAILSCEASDDGICNRFPSSPLCHNQGVQKLEEDTVVYCRKWRKHFGFYCDGDGRFDARAKEFCPYYKNTCRITTRPVTPPPLPKHSFRWFNNNGGGISGSGGGGNPQPILPTPPPAPQTQQFLPNQQPQAQPGPAQSGSPSFGGPIQPVQSGSPSFGGASSIGQPLGFLGGGSNFQGAGTQAGIPGSGAPLSFGQGVGVGPFANTFSGANINPLSGVSSGTSVNAAGIPISSTRGVSFGGLIPGGLSNLFSGK